MKLSLKPFVDIQNSLALMPMAFDIDYAVGAQLDRIGERVGISRQLSIPLQNLFFSFGDPLRGWGRGLWKGPYDTGSSLFALDDNTYRRLLKAKIRANYWDGTVEQAEAILRSFFNKPASYLFIQDNCDGSQTVALSGAYPDTLALAIFGQDLIPLKPNAVRSYHTVTTVPGKPLFGFGINNQYIGGWGFGTYGRSPDYIIASGINLPPQPRNPGYAGSETDLAGDELTSSGLEP